MKKILLLSILLLCFSCSKDESSIDDKQEKIPAVFALSTSVSPSEGGSISGGEETYNDGEEVTLTATPSEDFQFKEWQGDITGSENSVKFVMTSDKEVAAIFEKKVYSLDFDILGKWYFQSPSTSSTSQVNKGSNKQSENSSCSIKSIEFLKDGRFILITSEGEFTGKYVVDGSTSLDLGIGKIEDLSLTNDVLVFKINLDSDCSSNVSARLLTYVPDDTFEQELIKLGYDDSLDNFVNTLKIRTVKSLVFEISSSQIVDFTGLENFSSLESFIVFLSNNKSPEFEIDFSSNVNLKMLRLHGVEITDLNLVNNSFIEEVHLSKTSLSGSISFPNNPLLRKVQISENHHSSGVPINLDFTNNPNLKRFDAAGVRMEKLDISNNHILEMLTIRYGELQEIVTSGVYEHFKSFSITGNVYKRTIDFAMFPNLETLFFECPLETIDISSNINLYWLKLSGATNMNFLDLSNNSSLRDFSISDAPNLKCIEVNAEQLSKLNAEELYWTAGYNYSLECE